MSKIVLAVLAGVLAFSCTRDYEAPPFTEPEYTGLTNNITVARFKSKFAAATTNPTVIDSPLVMKATVVGNDISGNIYKSLYVQDETGGISLGVDQNSIYTNYAVGQEVFIELNGMAAVIAPGGELQVAYKGTSANRIPWDIFVKQVHQNRWPNPNAELVKPRKVKLSELSTAYSNTLVQIDTVFFTNEGKGQYAVSSSLSGVSQVIKDESNKSLDVRTSVYATFAADTLPLGYGTVTGILTRYSGTWQLALRSKNDVANFTGVRANILNESLLSQDSFNQFTPYSVSGAQVWAYASGFGAKVTGYTNVNNANEDWLISPSFSLVGKNAANLTFSHTARYFTANRLTEQVVLVSTNYNSGDPNAATWTPLTVPNWPSGANWTFINSGSISLADYAGQANVHIAFKYVSTTTGGATWEVQNVVVK